MAATRIDQYSAAQNPQFVWRVLASIVNAAQAISSETVASHAANHVNRLLLVKAVSNNPSAYAPIFATMLVGQAVDQVSTDAAIDTMVAACWDSVAGRDPTL